MQTFIAAFGGAFTGAGIGSFLGGWYYHRWERRRTARRIDKALASIRESSRRDSLACPIIGDDLA